MKKFIKNILLFIIIFPIPFYIRPLYLLIGEKYKETVSGSVVYHVIKKSKQKNKSKKLILGDSVGEQLFSSATNNDTINSLTSQQAIGMVGQYILLNNYLKAGNKIDTAYVLFRPFSFKDNLDQVFTYHYFLKPFFIDEYKALLTKTAHKQIAKIPYKFFCREPYVLTTNWAPNFESKDKIDYTFLSPISVEYLIKMKDLSNKHNFKLIALPTPMNENYRDSVQKINKAEISKHNLNAVFANYFEKIIYLNDSLFADSVHLKKPSFYTSYYKYNLIGR